MALPCAPQPKQWEMPFSSLTVKEGDFSLWKGQRPECSRPRFTSFTRRPTTAERVPRLRSTSRNSGAKARKRWGRNGKGEVAGQKGRRERYPAAGEVMARLDDGTRAERGRRGPERG